MNKPYELTALEWAEIAAARRVLEAFGLEYEEEPTAWLMRHAYGVRFGYASGGPGYCGPLYLVKCDGAPRIPPSILIRAKDGLEAVEGW